VKFPTIGRFGGDVNGGNGMERQEWEYGHLSLIEVGEDPPSGVWTIRLTRIAVVVVDMEGE